VQPVQGTGLVVVVVGGGGMRGRCRGGVGAGGYSSNSAQLAEAPVVQPACIAPVVQQAQAPIAQPMEGTGLVVGACVEVAAVALVRADIARRHPQVRATGVVKAAAVAWAV
jgi:hypothetical protein